MRLTGPSITSGDRTDPRQGDETVERTAARTEQALSRHAMLEHSGAAAAGIIVAGARGGAGGKALAATAGAAATSTRASTAGSDDLRPHDAFDSILAAMDRFPLVALGESHAGQVCHRFPLVFTSGAGACKRVGAPLPPAQRCHGHRR